MAFLIDTNVLSELRKGRRSDPGVRSWFAEVASDELYLSVLTLGELRKGVENIRRRDPTTATVLQRWLAEVIDAYSDRILQVDRDIAELWGRLNVPDPLPVIDSLLAATARVHHLSVVTRNVSDIERAGAACLNPFSDPT